MMTELQKEWMRRKQQSEERDYQQYGDIYEACVANGCDLDFVKSFATRIWFYPIEQTKVFIDSEARGQHRARVPKGPFLERWETYLSVLLKLRPDEDMTEKWREAKSLIVYYKKTGKFKNAEPFGFWLVGVGEREYTDILFEQNEEQSEIIQYLDRKYKYIMEICKGSEEKVSKIRCLLQERGYTKEVKQCDEAFIERYKP